MMERDEAWKAREARIRDLERELRDALAVTAAIILRYGEEMPDGGRSVLVTDADLEAINMDAPTVLREDSAIRGGFRLVVRP